MALGERRLLRLEGEDLGDTLDVLCPPDEYRLLPEPEPALDRRALTPLAIWQSLHRAAALRSPPPGRFSAFHACRLAPEPYQFAPLSRLLSDPSRSLLIADDVGLGKTIEAGLCIIELMARGVGRRVLVVAPPGLIPQWVDEMWDKFGLRFMPIENAASLDRAQTAISEGLQPWAYFDRVITSTEYLKRREAHAAALAQPWDVIVVDEAHYLAESGTPASPYSTARTRLGPKLRQATRSLLLLTATPHNGYRHSFRSLIELVAPTEATMHGKPKDIQRRVARSMIRRLKHQIVKTALDDSVPAFPPRLPVQRVEILGLSDEEREIFSLVATYCRKTSEAAAGTDDSDLVSFAMQIVKKRMLSSRAALRQTIKNRLEAVSTRKLDEPPARAEIRELQTDLPLSENDAERIAARVVRTAVSREAKWRTAEKKQLETIDKLLARIAHRADPKIAALVQDIAQEVLALPGEKAIVFTEYRDTLHALRDAFLGNEATRQAFVELTGGLTPHQRKARIARFHQADCRVLLATDAASEGLNLQKHCCRLYHVELPWNPNRLEQRNGRIDRHGQARPPLIKYLFHPDSPEEHVLDRLIQRIGQMHGDRVSTPDILGILESLRVDVVLQQVDTMTAAESAATSLLKVFEQQRHVFADEIAPLLIASHAPDSEELPFAHAVSADPMLEDDVELEHLMLETLGKDLAPGPLPGTWKFAVPRHLQGPNVQPRYACATFKRSTAIQYAAADVEFIHRLHPLAHALSEHCLRELIYMPVNGTSATRLAARRHPLAAVPFAVFTYFDLRADSRGQHIGVAVNTRGEVLPREVSDTFLTADPASGGNVSWQECEQAFAGVFDSLQRQAANAVLERLRASAALERARRQEVAGVLRDEAALYRVDRRAEIDRDEQLERAGRSDQMALFRETVSPWKARRAAIETHYTRRLQDIDGFAATPDPVAPQALGVLLVLPA